MTLCIWTLVGLLAAVAALRFAMGATKVDGEHLYAALSAYLLSGICFGLLCWLLEQMSSATFVFNFGVGGSIRFTAARGSFERVIGHSNLDDSKFEHVATLQTLAYTPARVGGLGHFLPVIS